MGDINPRQESFAAGEVDPGLWAAFHQPFYAKGVRKALNWIISKYGTLLNRSGTLKAASAKNGDKKARLFTFDFSDDQAHVLEVGHRYARIKNIAAGAVNNSRAHLVIVGNGTNDGVARYSEDGSVTWVESATLSDDPLSKVAARPDGSVVLAVGWNRTVQRSTDGGHTYTKILVGAAGTAWYAVHYTGARWVIAGSNGAYAHSVTGEDGTWTVGTVAIGVGTWWGLSSDGAGNVVAVGLEGTAAKCAKSADHGQTWGLAATIDALPAVAACRDVCWTGTYWMAVAYTAANLDQVVRSTDTAAWELVYAAGPDDYSAPRAIVYTGKEVLAVGSGYARRSPDQGATWETYSIPDGGWPSQAVSILGVAVTAGKKGPYATSVSTSTDGGKTWETRVISKNVPAAEYNGIAAWAVAETEIALPYDEADLPRLRMTQTGDVCLFTCQGYDPIELVRTGGLSAFIVRGARPTALPVVTGLAFVGAPNQVGDVDHVIKEWTWLVTWQAKGGRESLPSAGLSPPGSGKVCLYPDRPVSIQWTAMPGADVYHVYRKRNGRAGYVGSVQATPGAATVYFHDDGSTPVVSNDPPQWRNPFVGEPPAVAGMFEDRRVFGNTEPDPAGIQFSAVADYYDLDESLVKNDDDAFRRGLASDRYEEIRGLLWLDQLLVFTSESEWALGGAQGAPISEANISGKPETFHGCAWVRPLIIGKEAVFVQSAGNQVRNFYRGADGWDSDDLSWLVEHLFKGRRVVDWGYAHRPYGILWIVLDDGSLVTMTYNKKLEMLAWSRQATEAGDAFEAITIAPEGGVDVPWFIVKRGAARLIEKLAPRHALASAADFCGLDSAVYYNGVAVNSVVGLDHLNGRTVYGLADGVVRGPVVVAGGAANFGGAAAAKWWVGLRITADVESLDCPEARMKDKQIGRVFVETGTEELPLDASAGIYIGEDLAHLSRTSFGNGRKGVLEQIVESEPNPGGRFALRLVDPVPVEIKGVVREYAIGQ